MNIRRVVTARDQDGKSVVVSDGRSPRETALVHTPGFVSSPQWQAEGPPPLAFAGVDPMDNLRNVLPPLGGSTFVVVTFPPSSVTRSPDFRPDLAREEQRRASPGFADTFEKDNPGMHTTPTLDYGCVIDGEIWLELDDGKRVHLKRGDTVVQHAVRHAWRNLGEQPATMAFVLLGGAAKP